MNSKLREQQHLNHIDKINLGAFYTPKRYIDIVWSMIEPFIDKDTVILDSSCGYGNFFENRTNYKLLGNDIDKEAYNITKNIFKDIRLFNKNALSNINRSMFKIDKDDKLIIIGNPPYNDVTSIIRNRIKKETIIIDSDIKTRDYGISFLLSYAKLQADTICVLHPLSYLIKPANFRLLKGLKDNYRLIDSTIIDSATFKETSKGISFPIIIALYKRDNRGMNFEYIKEYKFKTLEEKTFRLSDFDFISNYIRKYPIKGKTPKSDDILFWTMRDINALKRNRTFIDKYSYNTIIIDKSKLEYYIYVDVFKQFSSHIPYYFGNLDVFIDLNLYERYRYFFIQEALTRHKFLNRFFRIDNIDINLIRQKIVEYFKILLGEHYVY
jgi:hypothetical protein